ncbi:MAG: hypothetical protein WD688_25200 [Candidatus Binatia bacterium]
MSQRLLFVSCGVHTEAEKALGRKIGEVIEKHKMISFLAPKVHQPADLNTHVFKELQRCDGFVAVLHKRGEIHYESFPVKHRASVWIQQEIGIIFYRSFLLGLDIPARIYQDQEILHEGLTTNSIINPIPFDNEEMLLEDLSEWLKGPTFDQHPVLTRRDDLFQRRIQDYEANQWLVLELIAAHSRNVGDDVDYNIVRNDFFKISPDPERLFERAWVRLREDGLIFRSDHTPLVLRLQPQWWDLVHEALRNRARVR